MRYTQLKFFVQINTHIVALNYYANQQCKNFDYIFPYLQDILKVFLYHCIIKFFHRIKS